MYTNPDGRTYSLSSIDTAKLATTKGLVGQVWSYLQEKENVCVVTDITQNEVLNTDLIEKLILPGHEKSKTAEEGAAKMSAPFRAFDDAGRLKSSDKKYKLQANNTCSHDCVWAWLEHSLDKTMFDCVSDFIFNKDLNTIDALSDKVDVDLRQDIQRLKVTGEKQKAEASKEIIEQYTALKKQVNSMYKK